MDQVYFLIVIGMIALVLVSWLATMDRRRKLKAKKQKSRTNHEAQVYDRHGGTVRHGLLSRTTSLPLRHMGAFEHRHQSAGEEIRHGSAIAAERIFSDEEIPDHEKTHGLEMPAIRFVSEGAAVSPGSWTSQPRR